MKTLAHYIGPDNLPAGERIDGFLSRRQAETALARRNPELEQIQITKLTYDFSTLNSGE